MKRFFLVSLVALLANHAPARAANTCLSGATELSDQRAIAALRTRMETDCPCDVMQSRRAYNTCARNHIAAAIATATLRAECRHTAQDLFRNSSCGAADRVACGRIAPNGKVSCHIKSAAACHARRDTQEHACTTISHCADVVDWTAGTCNDVRKYGAYNVGARVITYNKTSALNPNVPRALQTTIWYPTNATGPINGDTGGILNAPMASGGPFPVVMFSHGSCGYANQSVFYTATLASRGFIVAAPPHPGNTLFEYPACNTPAAQQASFPERPRDISFVLDQLLAANQDPESPFYGALDPTRIGMSGHSFGGLTVYLTVSADSRFIAAVPMAPATIGPLSLDIPSMYMIGGVDSVVNNPATKLAYAASTTPKHLVTIDDAGHYAFSTLCFVGNDCEPPRTLTQPEAHERVLRYVIPFMEVYVAGDQSFLPFLNAAPPPGVSYEAEQ